MSVNVEYEALAPGAASDMKIATPILDKDKPESYCNLDDFNKGLDYKNFSFPTEGYQTLLDGEQLLFPQSFEQYPNIGFGFVSSILSNNYGGFDEAISIVFKSQSKKKYISQGITLHFDSYNNIYANSLAIIWSADGKTISSKTFNPNSPVYFCKNEVTDYDAIEIHINSLNMPNCRMRLIGVDFGAFFDFTGDMLESVNVIQEINPISTELPISVCDITLRAENASDYNFQNFQKLTIKHNGDTKATGFIKSYRRTGEFKYQLECVDSISLLDNATFMGGVYSSKPAKAIITDILKAANIEGFLYDPIDELRVSGYIPICSCREALILVGFAIGRTIVSSNDTIYVQELSDTVSQTVELERIFQGQNFDINGMVTEVKLITHRYKTANTEEELYKSADSGSGNGIRVEFDNPMHDLTITNGAIVETNTSIGKTYAVINANDNCILKGKKYSDTKLIQSFKNSNILFATPDNVVTVESTLYEDNNYNNIFSKACQYLMKNSSVNLKIVEGSRIDDETDELITDKPVNLGDMLTCKTEYMGDFTGRLVSQRYSLGGGIIVKECVVK